MKKISIAILLLSGFTFINAGAFSSSEKTYHCFVQFVNWKKYPQLDGYSQAPSKWIAERRMKSFYQNKGYKVKSVECIGR